MAGDVVDIPLPIVTHHLYEGHPVLVRTRSAKIGGQAPLRSQIKRGWNNHVIFIQEVLDRATIPFVQPILILIEGARLDLFPAGHMMVAEVEVLTIGLETDNVWRLVSTSPHIIVAIHAGETRTQKRLFLDNILLHDAISDAMAMAMAMAMALAMALAMAMAKF